MVGPTSKTIHLGFTITGRVELELTGDPFLAFFLDNTKP
jgi:hypothetical protein